MVTEYSLAPAEPAGIGPWPRLLAACVLSVMLHMILLGVPVNPTGGAPEMMSTIQARLEPADTADGNAAAPEVTPVPEKAVSPLTEPPEKPVQPRERPEPAAKPAAATPPSPATGIEVPLIRDPTYYPARQLDVYPQPVVMIQPKCPDGAIAQRINGRVQLLLLIDEFGVVNDTSIVDAQPAGVFDDVTVQAFRVARFVPAQKQGHNVKSRVVLRVNFLCSDTEAAAR